ncbi:MAG: DUF4058 family protein [Planctomycetota bacterium]|nr:MAG: DUF4058 family protein [Planctomycetota bacterium]REJ91154.1 MAG: DUF4058 family protein [Planctomycetota bacterium]REK20365.1 MAG: DUF4058 family protein [Planctomycetota bacterium]REK26862.1 MAG: DUF4058 family protein [Planctomycetota bacterium]
MPSPFPGMDPFIEGQLWGDFHAGFVPVLRELLIPHVRPNYTVNVERYVFLVDEDGEQVEHHYAPDASVVEGGGLPGSAPAGATATLAPHVLTLPMPSNVAQKYLVIRSRERGDVVALIEVLSPWNKRAADGQPEYLQKRANYLRTETHIIEIDLLRVGSRLPTIEPLPPGDYFAFVARAGRRPKVDVFAWMMRDRLPTIPIPLKEGDDDVALDLQEAHDLTYDRGGYDYALDYGRDPEPPLSEGDREWAATILRTRPTAAGPPTAET